MSFVVEKDNVITERAFVTQAGEVPEFMLYLIFQELIANYVFYYVTCLTHKRIALFLVIAIIEGSAFH